MTVLKNICILSLLTIITNCASKENIQYKKWITSDPIFTARSDNALDNVAVKDPSIVYYNGKYHLFYTAKCSRKTGNSIKYDIGTAYASAPTLEKLNTAERYSIDSVVAGMVIAPQIFYFEPHKLWYLIAHTKITGKRRLMPIYMTNPDIENVNGWSRYKILETGKSTDKFWIDFWVICDTKKAYLFYADQNGSILRIETPIEHFPEGFSYQKEQIALTVKGVKNSLNWRMFEAAHIYHVKKDNKYLAILEGAYEHPIRKNDINSKNRFIFAMTSDSLDGTWRRVEESENEFLAEAENLYNEDGSKSKYTQVSHPELIRSGYNQRLEIKDYDLQILFQTFDGTKISDIYDYDELPWELVVIKNN
jgi:endo-1,4-beta-xylanase